MLGKRPPPPVPGKYDSGVIGGNGLGKRGGLARPELIGPIGPKEPIGTIG
jgi:hypothetical protein